jgi:hypothetical protein
MYIKKILKYVLLYGLVLGIGLLLLVLSACIPRQWVQQHSEGSAVYLNEKPLFAPLLDGQKWTTVDNYADTISLSIAYSFDDKQPLKSALEANYHKEPTLNVNEAYKLGVMAQQQGSTPYTRYWHGSTVLLKPLLMFLDIRGIRWLSALVVVGLSAGLSVVLYKKQHKLLLLSFVLGLVFTAAWMVPLCVEYTSTVIVMLLVLWALILIQPQNVSPVFFVTGIVTCYFDFLTTETITITVPLLFLLCLAFENGQLTDFMQGFRLTIKTGLLWALGYGLMWVSKWSISSIVLGRNTFIEAAQQVQLRTVGEAASGPVQQLIGALFRNVALLFPMFFGKTYGQVFLLFVALMFVLSCLWLWYGGKVNTLWFTKLLLLIGLLPYMRYSVLNNHSYLHYLFTYRAQLVTVMALSYCFVYSLDKKLLRRTLGVKSR